MVDELLPELYIFVVFVLSSFMQTATGFGYAIITAPLLALVLGPKETVMLTLLTGLFIKLIMLKTIRNEGSFKEILPLITASVVAAIPGAYVMTIISNDALKVFIGVILFLAALILWKDCQLPVGNHRLAEAAVGACSGFLATTTSINGPPIILYYLNSNLEENKKVFRGNLTRYFLLLNIASLSLSFAAGTLKPGELWFHALLSLPALFLGFWLGEKLFNRINAATFRKASLGLVFLSSLAIIGSACLRHF